MLDALPRGALFESNRVLQNWGAYHRARALALHDCYRRITHIMCRYQILQRRLKHFEIGGTPKNKQCTMMYRVWRR